MSMFAYFSILSIPELIYPVRSDISVNDMAEFGSCAKLWHAGLFCGEISTDVCDSVDIPTTNDVEQYFKFLTITHTQTLVQLTHEAETRPCA